MLKIIKLTLLLVLCIGILAAYDFPAIPGWEQTDPIETYTSDNLWNYINGAADGYLDYGFEKLKTGRFQSGATEITIDIYDMGNKLNAYGIYVTERADEYTPLHIGVESTILPPSEANMLKNQYYIFIRRRAGEISEENGKTLLNAIEKALPGDNKPPEILKMLPGKNKIKGSTNYIKKDFMSMASLNNIILADYKRDTSEYRLFYFVDSKDDPEKYWTELGAGWDTYESGNSTIKIREIPYQGKIGIIKTERGIYGIANVDDKKQIATVLKSLEKN